MSDSTTRSRGRSDLKTMRGSINERIREVLQYMKMHGFTLVSSLLVAMCDSRAHDIKYLAGRILGSWGVFTELVELLFVTDNATALFKLKYDSHMCILNRQVTIDKFQAELDCISKHRELRQSVSDFAEVDWESQDFGSIGEAIQQAASATTEPVEQLCGVTAITADCPAHSRGRYTGSSAIGDAKDHWGLNSPAPFEKRKMISVVAMSLHRFVN